MLHVKYLQLLQRTSKYLCGRSTTFGKAYYCDKKKILLDTADLKKTELVAEHSEPEPIEKKSCEEIEKIAFDKESEIDTVLTEKEREASVQSRLSKEYTTLKIDLKNRLSTSSGINLHLDDNCAKGSGWADYAFEGAIGGGLRKHGSAPIVSASSTCSNPASGGSGSTSKGRIVRQEPGKVIAAFIPHEWFHFFVPKTGATGFATFIFTFGTYLLSKEILVLEHNFYNGVSMFFVWWGAIKYVGPFISKLLDKQIDDYENEWKQGRIDQQKILEEQIEDEHLAQLSADGQLILLEAKKENVALQLEEEFRIRQMTVYNEVLQRLDYQVALANVYKKIFHKNLLDYVNREVRKSITPDMEKQLLSVSIETILPELEKGGGGKK